MKNIFLCLSLLCFPLFLLSGCGGAAPSAQSEVAEKAGHSCEACTKGKAGETAWCDGCKKGFVDGKETKCKACFEGKSGKNTWCEKCNKGYVDGKKTGCKGCYKAKSEGKACEGCAKPAPKKEPAEAAEEKTPTAEPTEKSATEG